MTKSLNVGLKHGIVSNNVNRMSKEKQTSGANLTTSPQGAENGILSKSLASFHLSPAGNNLGRNDAESTGGKALDSKQKILMDQSVDQLFKEGEAAAAQLINPLEEAGQMKDTQNIPPNTSNQASYNKMNPDSIALRHTSRNQQVCYNLRAT